MSMSTTLSRLQADHLEQNGYSSEKSLRKRNALPLTKHTIQIGRINHTVQTERPVRAYLSRCIAALDPPRAVISQSLMSAQITCTRLTVKGQSGVPITDQWNHLRDSPQLLYTLQHYHASRKILGRPPNHVSCQKNLVGALQWRPSLLSSSHARLIIIGQNEIALPICDGALQVTLQRSFGTGNGRVIPTVNWSKRYCEDLEMREWRRSTGRNYAIASVDEVKRFSPYTKK